MFLMYCIVFSPSIKSGQLAVIYMCVSDIDFTPCFLDFSIILWNCFDVVVFLAFQCFYSFYYLASKYGVTKLKGKRPLRLDNYIP